ncbi:MAG TPA: isoprenylcysteine carboxylmethyltransferase family protein [Burkholderiales bacterium]
MSATGPSSRLLVPPVYFLVALLLMVFFHRVAPWAQVLEAPYCYAGIVLAALALGLGAWAAVLFRRAGTDVRPFMPSTALVVAGPYRLTRNPMYLGMAGILLGAAIFMGSLTPFVVIPAFMALITERFILPEEAKLEAAFGRDYLDFKARVRRWL